MRRFAPTVLAMAVSVAAFAADDAARESQARSALAAVVAAEPQRQVHAAAFFKEAMTADGAAQSVTSGAWAGVEILAFRHETGTQRGWYPRDPAVSVEDTLRDYADTMKRMLGVENLRIVGADLKGEAAKVKALESEGVMVEISAPGFFPPAPAFTMPDKQQPVQPTAEPCSVFDAAGNCASPFRPGEPK